MRTASLRRLTGVALAGGMAAGLVLTGCGTTAEGGSAAGGAAEIAGAGAVLVPPGDAEALAAALLRLADDAELRARLGRAGRAHAGSHFGRARLAAGVARVYRGVAGG